MIMYAFCQPDKSFLKPEIMAFTICRQADCHSSNPFLFLPDQGRRRGQIREPDYCFVLRLMRSCRRRKALPARLAESGSGLRPR